MLVCFQLSGVIHLDPDCLGRVRVAARLSRVVNRDRMAGRLVAVIHICYITSSLMRDVRFPEGQKDAVVKSIARAGADAIDACFMLVDELRTGDPDLSERCGAIDERYEVFAIRVPGVDSLRLVAAISMAGDHAVIAGGMLVGFLTPAELGRRATDFAGSCLGTTGSFDYADPPPEI